jgi:hypothetical protein
VTATEKNLQGEEDEDLGKDSSLVGVGVDTKGLKGGEENQDGGPTMVQREGEMDPNFGVRG